LENRTTQIPVSLEDYMKLSDAIDGHSKALMRIKGEEYSTGQDFLEMENRLAGMLGDSPEYVSLVMAGKHITSLGIILGKNEVDKIDLAKWDERIRDAINLLKITSAFIHAKQNDFSLHLSKIEGENKAGSDLSLKIKDLGLRSGELPSTLQNIYLKGLK
jgi:hypothetical protein